MAGKKKETVPSFEIKADHPLASQMLNAIAAICHGVASSEEMSEIHKAQKDFNAFAKADRKPSD